MGFTLKKILSAFLMPLPIGVLLIFIGIFFLYVKSYKKAKLFLAFAFIWILLISNSFFSYTLLEPLESKYSSLLTPNPTIKYVHVLGSGHISNSNISVISQNSQTAMMRLTEGIRLYRLLDNAKLILTGYAGGDSTPHALIQFRVAIALGVSKEDIIVRIEPKDTQEEALSVKKIVKNNPFILVTSASHIPRAMTIFKDSGLNPIAAPTNYYAKKEGEIFSFPSGGDVYKTQIAMHEYLGILWHQLKSLLH